jgi:hypothetical protein
MFPMVSRSVAERCRTPEHLEYHVLGADPVGKLPIQPDPQDPGARQVIGITRHGQGHIQSSRADAQHGDPRGARGVTVGTQKGLPGDAEPLHVHLVRNAVARGTEVQPVAGAGRLEVAVIVGVLIVGLKDVVVHVLDGQLRAHPMDPQGLQLQHGHGPGRILEQDVIDADGDLPPRSQASLHQVGFQDLMGEIPCQGSLLEALDGLMLDGEPPGSGNQLGSPAPKGLLAGRCPPRERQSP